MIMRGTGVPSTLVRTYYSPKIRIKRNNNELSLVDDGTGCVEINHNEPKPPETTNQFRSKPKDPLNPAHGHGRQSTPSHHPDTAASRGPTRILPDWSIGRFVVRVRQTPKARFVDLVSMERLRSAQEEVDHWKHVMRLHETRYREPFVIPKFPPPPLIVAPPPTTPVKRGSSAKPSSPTQIRLIPPPISPVKEHVEVCTICTPFCSSRHLTRILRMMIELFSNNLRTI